MVETQNLIGMTSRDPVRGMKKRVLLLFAAGCFAQSLLFAQDGSLEVSIDKNPVGLGDQFTLSFTLNNAGAGGGKNLRLPDLSTFQIVGGPNQSTSMQFINGSVSSSVTYSYILQPTATGKFTIGAAAIDAGGKTYTSKPITLEVVKGTPQPKQQSQQIAPADLGVQIGDNLFLKAAVDKSRVLRGEQLNLTIKLYWRLSVVNIGVNKLPAMTGFWSEDIELPKNQPPSVETYNGKRYNVAVVKHSAMFPTQAGTLEISPMEVKTVLQVRSRSVDPFDAFFGDPFGRQVEYMVKSEPIKIKVDPLPAGAPSGFKGAVGRFTMNATVDKKTAKTNDPISYKLTISGSGNVKLLEAPEIEVPADFEKYSPKVSENIARPGGLLSGSKTFEYLLIPRYPGHKVIKPVTFSFFDLAKREYLTLTSPQIDLTIEQGAAPLVPLVAGGGRSDVQLLSQDIRFIKLAHVAFSRRDAYLHTSPVFLVLLLLPIGTVVGAFVYARQRKAVMLDEAGYRNRRAMRVAQKGLKQAEHLLKGKEASTADKKAEFYTEVSRAVYKYLGDKLAIQQAEMSIEGTTAELARRSVDGTLTSALKSLLESCEMARFAPTMLGAPAMQQTYNEAARLIIELEKTLKTK